MHSNLSQISPEWKRAPFLAPSKEGKLSQLGGKKVTQMFNWAEPEFVPGTLWLEGRDNHCADHGAVKMRKYKISLIRSFIHQRVYICISAGNFLCLNPAL